MPSSEQGITHDRYMLIPRTLVFLTRRDRVLLLKGAPDKRLWAGKYNGVGGHVERGEDLLSAARRELLEETGLRPDSLWLCATITVDAGEEVGIGIYVLRGECAEGELHPSAEGTLEWVPINQVNQLPLVEDLHELLPRVLALRPGDPPLIGHYHYDENDKLATDFHPS